MAWRTTAVENGTILELIIKKRAGEHQDIPSQLVALVHTFISMTSLKIDWLKADHKNERLVQRFSGLIVVLWDLYLAEKPKFRKIWPQIALERAIDKLAIIIDKVQKLAERSGEKNVGRKMMFSILNLGKVQKYSWRLHCLASSIEKAFKLQRKNVDLDASILEAVSEYKSAQNNLELVAQAFGQQEAAKPSVSKGNKKRTKSFAIEEEDQWEDKSFLDKDEEESDKEHYDDLEEEQITAQRRSSPIRRRTYMENGNGEGSSRQVHTAQSKKRRKGQGAPESPKKARKKFQAEDRRAPSSPSSPQLGPFNVCTTGSGTTNIQNSGNTYCVDISDCGNDRSVHHRYIG